MKEKMKTQLSGEELYRRYTEGDESGFDGLIGLYRNDLTAYARSIIKDEALAEDCAVEAFAELAIKKKYNFSIPIKSYLMMICRCRALDQLKKYRRTVRLSDVGEEFLPYTQAEFSDEYAEKDELKRTIRALPEKQRSAVWLVYIDGMSYKEAATAMKITVKKLDKLLAAAKKNLKDKMRYDG